MKAQVRKIYVELKSMNKGNRSMTEYVLRVKYNVNYLLNVGDSIFKQDQIDSILDGLSEKYNMFFMQMYGNSDPIRLFDVDELLQDQEAQLDKLSQEFVVYGVTVKTDQ